ncbi:MAG: glutamine amidotransferase [Xanthomonadaceae bacterium]|nr:glutamine amidotransferase [Xanthomonadaceae bacterium]
MANILMIVTSAGTMPNGHATGLWLEEFAVPYATLRDAGHAITVASPKGGDTPIDPRSSGAAEQHPEWQEAAQRLQQTQPLDGLHADDFAAVFIPGGHGTMFDFPDNPRLGTLLAEFHAQGKPIASVCHGPAAFVGVTREDGKPLVEGYTLTAFSNIEENLSGLAEVVPFLLSTRLVELGANVENSVPMLSHVRQDRQLITGQNPKSSERVAGLLVELLEQGVSARRPTGPSPTLGMQDSLR